MEQAHLGLFEGTRGPRILQRGLRTLRCLELGVTIFTAFSSKYTNVYVKMSEKKVFRKLGNCNLAAFDKKCIIFQLREVYQLINKLLKFLGKLCILNIKEDFVVKLFVPIKMLDSEIHNIVFIGNVSEKYYVI